MAAANKIVRKFKSDKAAGIEALKASGYSEAVATGLFEPDFCGRVGFASYQLSNNNANIRRMKERVAHLERNATRETNEVEREDGVKIIQNAEINRLQIFFPGKPDAAIRSNLKAHGFRWSPNEGAWQRHLSNSAIWAAEHALKVQGQAP
jgi:hypothetical protein